MTQEIIIEAGRAQRRQYRELFRVLAWRDVAVRYKQTVIGAAWAIIRPFLTMVVFTVIFGKLAKSEYEIAKKALLLAASQANVDPASCG